MALPSFEDFKTTTTGGGSTLPSVDDFVTTKKKATESNQEYASFVKFASSMDDDAVANIATQFKNDWDYDEADGEDLDRKNSGKIPKALENSYTSSATDKWLQSRGLPSAKKLEKYIENYNAHVTNKNVTNNAKNDIIEKWNDILAEKGQLSEDDAAAAYWDVANSADYADYLDYFKSEHDTFDKTVSDYDTESEFLEAQSKFDTKDTEYDLFFRDMFDAASNELKKQQEAVTEEEAKHQIAVDARANIVNRVFSDYFIDTVGGAEEGMRSSLDAAAAALKNKGFTASENAELRLREQGLTDDEIEEAFNAAGRGMDYNFAAKQEAEKLRKKREEAEDETVKGILANLTASADPEAVKTVRRIMNAPEGLLPVVSFDNSLEGYERLQAAYADEMPKVNRAENTLREQGYTDEQITAAFYAAGFKRDVENTSAGQNTAAAIAQSFIDNGATELEAYNAMARNNLRVNSEKHIATAYANALSEIGMSDEDIALHLNSMTDEEKRAMLGSYEFDPSIQTSKDKQILLTAVSVPLRATLSIVSGLVGFADLLSSEDASSARHLGEASQYLARASAKMRNLGTDVNTPVMNFVSDAGSELLRMYATSAAGAALAGIGGASAAASTASATGIKAALKGIAKKAVSVESIPFIATAMGNYFTEAIMSGADRKQATLYSVVAGYAEGAIEAMSTSLMFDKFFKKGVAASRAEKGLKWLTSDLGVNGANMIASAFGEGLEEVASYFVSGGMQKITFNPDWSTNWEDLKDQALMGMFLGAFGSAASSHGLAGELFGRLQKGFEATGSVDMGLVDTISSAIEVEEMPVAKRKSIIGAILDRATFTKKTADAAKATVNIENAKTDHAERTRFLEKQSEESKERVDRAQRNLKAVAGDPNKVVAAATTYKSAESADSAKQESIQSQRVKADKEFAGVTNNNQQILDAANAELDAHHVGVVADLEASQLAAQEAAAAAEQILAEVEARNAQDQVLAEDVEQTADGSAILSEDAPQDTVFDGGTVTAEQGVWKKRKTAENTYRAFWDEAKVAAMQEYENIEDYESIPEIRSLEMAEQRIDEFGAEQFTNMLLDRHRVWDAADADAAMALADNALIRGDYGTAAEITAEHAARMTTSAQIVQSAAKYSRTPVGMVVEAQRNVEQAEQKAEKNHPKKVKKIDNETAEVVDALNNGIAVEQAVEKVKVKPDVKKMVEQKLNDLVQKGRVTEQSVRDVIKEANGLPVLTEEEISEIVRLTEVSTSAETDRERQEAAYRVGLIISSKLGTGTLMEKIRAFSYMNMLLNINTGMKNFDANIPMFFAETFKDIIATPVDILVSKKTGERTTTIASAKRFTSIPKAAVQGMKDAILDIKHDTYTSFLPGRVEYKIKGNTFKSKFLNRLERLIGQWMGIGDRMWASIAYDGRLAELKSLGKDINTDAARKDAELYAIDRVFQNNSALAERALKARRSLGVFGDIILPFARTPANIADKLLDYSPVGLGRAIHQWGKTAGTDAFNQKLFVDRVGRSLTGTGILLLGAALAAKGILVSSPDDSEEREAMKNAGVGAHSLKFGDTYHTIEWASPVGTLLLMGGAMSNVFDKDTLASQASASEIAINGAQEGINAFFSNSFLSGVADLIGAENVGEAITDAVINSTSRATPSQLSALARIFDEYERDTYDTDPLVAQGKYLLSRIPGLRNLLPEKIATDGTYMENTTGDTIVGRAVENLIDPGNTTRLTDDPVHREIYRLSSEGLSGHTLPTAEYSLSWTVNKVKTTHKLTEEERREYQQMLGEATYAAAQTVINDPSYANWDDETRSEKLKKAVDDAANSARKQYRNILKEKGGN